MDDHLARWQDESRRLAAKNQQDWENEERDWWDLVLMGDSVLRNSGYCPEVKFRGGSRPGKKRNIWRDRAQGHQRIWADYFAKEPVYPEKLFRRRYRMRRPLFWRIHDVVCANDPYFVQKKDAAGVLGLSSIQKITAALRMLSLGVSTDARDEYVQIAESTAMVSLKRFTKSVWAVFQEEYLRQPTKEDMTNQFKVNDARGFPGMFASLDCMHYEWKNCPVAWQGLFTNKDGQKSIVLEAIVDQSLWLWHAYFGLPGGNNDINALDRSPLVNNFLRSEADEVSFIVNGRQYSRYYLLADGIYPDWTIFVKTINLPQGDCRKWFAKCQEAARKDVEPAFGVLQQRFAIVRNPVRMHYQHEFRDVLLCCVILHNMLVEDELHDNFPTDWDFSRRARGEAGRDLGNQDWKDYLDATRAIEDSETHFSLRNDLMLHLWKLKGEGHKFKYVGTQDL